MRQTNSQNTPMFELGKLFRAMTFFYVIAITFQSQSPIQAKNHELKVFPEIKKIDELVFEYEGITWRDKEKLHSALRARLNKALPVAHKTRAAKISREIINQSQKHKINPLLVMAFIQTESSFKPDAVGPVGEVGLMQLRYRTAQYIASKYNLNLKNEKELKNPITNIRFGVAYLAYLKDKYGEEPYYMVPAYNVGPTKLQQKLNENKIPQIYAGKIVKNYNLFAKIIRQESMPRNSQRKKTVDQKSQEPRDITTASFTRAISI
jgi:hypothetical protein